MAAGITVAQLINAVKSLLTSVPQVSVPQVSVEQLWDVVYELGENASSETEQRVELEHKLEDACQAIYPSCTATSVSRHRRALLTGKGKGQGKGQGKGNGEGKSQGSTLESENTGTVTFSRSLSDGNITEIPQLEASGVNVTHSTFSSANALLSMPLQGGVAEAGALLAASLSKGNVTSALSARLGLDQDTFFVDVQPIFPPMPPSSPPLLPPPPSPPSLPPPPSPPSSPPAGDSSPPPPVSPPPASDGAEHEEKTSDGGGNAGTVVGSIVGVLLFLGLVAAAVRWYRHGRGWQSSRRPKPLMPRMAHETEFEEFAPLGSTPFHR